ncbi:FAD binding domain-containing protein [Halovivax gelatinilyticus]|uniref:FAD binding domain-containing protein n=1 Tax=Halovivax gelatinilyticus TaxID=2961597 RepID=UPI0020CA48C2|nr:FAD binding domain-containing protein [Halovivax gelatinilyticus]
MYPAPFEYRRASTVDDAVSTLSAEPDRDVRVLAGGHGLLPAMKTEGLSPDVLVDIGDCDELRGIAREDAPANGGPPGLSVGALTTHAELAASDLVADHAPALAEAARAVGDVQIRTRGTIAGNIAEADPGADLPAALVAGDATIRIRGPDGERSVNAIDFCRGNGETALAADELITDVFVPSCEAGAYEKRTHPARGFAMVGVAVSLDIDGAAIDDVRIGAVGATDRPVRLASVEAEIGGLSVESRDGGDASDEMAGDVATRIEAAASKASADLPDGDRHGDHHASGAFRAEILGPHVERALTRAVARIDGGGGE